MFEVPTYNLPSYAAALGPVMAQPALGLAARERDETSDGHLP